MSDAIWYYAQNDQERGPVSATELRSMAASGKLRGSDLVWKEGMEIWTAASQVKGLLPEAATPPAGTSDSAARPRSAVRDSNREAGPREAGPREARWIDGPPADDATPATAPRVPTSAPSQSTSRNPQAAVAPRPAGELLAELPKYLRLFGIGLIAVGLLLVLAAKGCDTLADHYTARVLALARVEQERFQQQWNRERQTLEAEIEALAAKSNPTPAEQNQLVSRRMELTKLNEENAAEETQLRQGRWAELRSAAATAADDNLAWGFWRAILFVFGTLVLVPGLLVVGFTGQNAERWIALGILGVVIYSLYMAGSAWTFPVGS